MSNNLKDFDSLLLNRARQLENIVLFQGVDLTILTELSSLMKEVHYKKNTVVINQGEISRNLFIVVYGRLKVFATDEDGNQTIFSFLHSDNFFGELSLIDDAPRSATVITLEDAVLLSLSHSDFFEFINKHTDLYWPLFKSLTNRIRQMDETICTLTSRDIYGRLVETLYDQAQENNNGVLITDKLTHQDLAEMIGSSREMISRIFADLKNGGYIEVDKKQVIILKQLPERL